MIIPFRFSADPQTERPEDATTALRSGWARLAFFVGVLLTVGSDSARAQDTTPPPQGGVLGASEVRAGVHVSPRFVMRDGDGYTGMAAELSEAVLTEDDADPVYTEYESYRTPSLRSAPARSTSP